LSPIDAAGDVAARSQEAFSGGTMMKQYVTLVSGRAAERLQRFQLVGGDNASKCSFIDPTFSAQTTRRRHPRRRRPSRRGGVPTTIRPLKRVGRAARRPTGCDVNRFRGRNRHRSFIGDGLIFRQNGLCGV